MYLPSSISLLGSAVVAVVTAGHNTQLVLVVGGGVGGCWCTIFTLSSHDPDNNQTVPVPTPASQITSQLKRTAEFLV